VRAARVAPQFSAPGAALRGEPMSPKEAHAWREATSSRAAVAAEGDAIAAWMYERRRHRGRIGPTAKSERLRVSRSQRGAIVNHPRRLQARIVA